jgi:hypothetical protein
VAQSKRIDGVKKVSLGQRWNKAQPSKTTVFWLLVAAIILTMIVGFNWGGWVTGNTAQRLAESTARDAVIDRLSSICVGQFNLDPGRAQKLQEMTGAKGSQRVTYVKDQGWATMPGEEKPDNRVADACTTRLVQLNQ